jgi:hypothetical protein
VGRRSLSLQCFSIEIRSRDRRRRSFSQDAVAVY